MQTTNPKIGTSDMIKAKAHTIRGILGMRHFRMNIISPIMIIIGKI